MGQWLTPRSNLESVTAGPLVQPNEDRVAVFICNLGPSACHISTEPGDVGTTQGIPLAVNGIAEFRWGAHGQLARCIWYITDPAPAQDFYIQECLYYSDNEGIVNEQ